jgi:hypothetical protein
MSRPHGIGRRDVARVYGPSRRSRWDIQLIKR